LRSEFFNTPATRRGNGHGGLVRLNFDQILAGFNGVAGFDEKIDDVGLGDGFTELRHDDGNLGHNSVKQQSNKVTKISEQKFPLTLFLRFFVVGFS
jgi:hypothetical protein